MAATLHFVVVLLGRALSVSTRFQPKIYLGFTLVHALWFTTL